MIPLLAFSTFSALLLLTFVLWRQRLLLAQRNALLVQLEVGALQTTPAGRIRWHTPRAAELLGRSGQSLQGQELHELLDASQTYPLQLDSLPGPGSLLLLRPILDEAERFQRSQYFARIGTWDWDIDTNQLYWSEAIYAMFGYSVGAVTPSYELFCASVHPDDRAQVRAGELRCIETGENHDEEYRVLWPNGTVRWLRETGNVVKNGQGVAVKMMGVVRDITEEKNWARQMHQLAHHDPLTGLPNRLLFEDHLRTALERARRNSMRVALVFIDLNGFKTINDTHGHIAGDHVLVATAQRLKTALRESDSVARIGGDEFVVILENLPLSRPLSEEARNIGEKILAALTVPLSVAGRQQQIGASLGIAAYPDHGASLDKLIHIADLAMYEAKRSGENQYRMGANSPKHVHSE